MYNHPPEGGVKQKKMSGIKLEVGKTYRNRSGEEVRITGFAEGIQYPYKGDKGKWYAESGQWWNEENPHDLIEEVPSETTRHTFAIPDGVKEITLGYFGNRIVVEMVPEKAPKPGDVRINDSGSVYIFKSIYRDLWHSHYVWFGEDSGLSIGASCLPGRPATPEEAQPLWDALKKAGKRWNPETMQVEDVPEADRIREWVERHLEDGHYNQEGIAEVIGHYLKHKEATK